MSSLGCWVFLIECDFHYLQFCIIFCGHIKMRKKMLILTVILTYYFIFCFRPLLLSGVNTVSKSLTSPFFPSPSPHLLVHFHLNP